MEWFALIVPIISCVVALKFFKEKFSWWEYLIPPAITVLTIVICKLCVKTSLISDNEYWGSIIKEARYYESWQTWVTQTCSYTTTCCCDKDGNNCQTETHYYDCSYCDDNGAYWKAYDDAGNSWNISESYYNYLKDKWKAEPRFVELNRSIDFSGGCGKDGDAYSISWNGDINTSEAAVTIHDYTNRVQASHSSFKLPYISEKEAKKLGLYEYPDKYNYYKQKVILGLDSIYSKSEVERIETMFQYFNGYYGSRSKIKLFLCLFYDKGERISYKQEAYWSGGNQNEVVVCIGMDRNKKIDWVRAFSWTDRKRILVDCREDIASLGYFKPDSVYLAIEGTVKNNTSVYKDFNKDFSYLQVELPSWSLWLIWILTIVFTGASWYWCFINEFDINN